MSESDTPGAVRSNDLLGPLPEPAAWHCYWRGDNDSVSWDQWHDASDPMPATWDDGDAPDEVTPHYTADQIRAYAAQQVAAERERCITAVFAWAHDQQPGAMFSAPAAVERIVKRL